MPLYSSIPDGTALPRQELAIVYTLPVWSYPDKTKFQMVYITPRGSEMREIGRLDMDAAKSYVEFFDLEIALMERNRPEDWSI